MQNNNSFMKKYFKLISIFIISIFFLLSCGLEEFYYIHYINDPRDLTYESSTITLPSSYADGYGADEYFSNFIIYYRIYLSNAPYSTEFPDATHFQQINNTLLSDFNHFYSITDKTSTSYAYSTTLENHFYSRNFFKMVLENEDGSPANINNVLSRSSLGDTIDFIFLPNPGEKPKLHVRSTGRYYHFIRASSTPSFSFITKPDEHKIFFNEEDIRNYNYAIRENNADVVRINNVENTMYSYVMMYIAAQGIDREIPPRYIYSQPTFIGVFRLPQPF